MINITNKIKCSGCSACAQICPKGCITMKEDSEGFLYPYVEHKECINCGLCEKICPIMDNCSNSDDIELSYAAYAYDDELRMKSSSGGIFSLCAEWILSQSGIVFGAAFDENFMVSLYRD